MSKATWYNTSIEIEGKSIFRQGLETTTVSTVTISTCDSELHDLIAAAIEKIVDRRA